MENYISKRMHGLFHEEFHEEEGNMKREIDYFELPSDLPVNVRERMQPNEKYESYMEGDLEKTV
tara:strand:+ start:383 stop:574 length:192 start_codon:yes stop_codon:yes gene_type:complete